MEPQSPLLYCFPSRQTLKDPTVIGAYDTIAVYADQDALEFFKKNNFTDDVVLNSRFRYCTVGTVDCVSVTDC